MITTEDITRIAKTGETIQEGDYLIKVFRSSEGYDAVYWCMSMWRPGVGGWGGGFAKRLTEGVKERMVKAIYDHLERMSK